MRALLPYLTLYRCHGGQLALGVALAIVTLLASIGLLTLSGWFLAGAAITRTAGRLGGAGYCAANHLILKGKIFDTLKKTHKSNLFDTNYCTHVTFLTQAKETP